MGVNQFEDDEDSDIIKLQKIDKNAVAEQLDRLKLFKSNRDNNIVKSKLEQFKKILNQDTNLLPMIIDCIKHNCTLGEICKIMRDVHGEHV